MVLGKKGFKSTETKAAKEEEIALKAEAKAKEEAEKKAVKDAEAEAKEKAAAEKAEAAVVLKLAKADATRRIKFKIKPYVIKHGRVERMWHPDQKIFITRDPVELKLDNWVECQLKAGLIKEV